MTPNPPHAPELRVFARGARAALATGALVVNASIAFVALSWSCCGGSDLASNATDPLFWSSLSGAVVALLAVPPLSRRTLRGARRWLVLPFVAGTLPVFLAAPEVVAETGWWYLETGWWYLAGVLATGVCAVYVAARVLAFSPDSRALG